MWSWAVSVSSWGVGEVALGLLVLRFAFACEQDVLVDAQGDPAGVAGDELQFGVGEARMPR